MRINPMLRNDKLIEVHIRKLIISGKKNYSDLDMLDRCHLAALVLAVDYPKGQLEFLTANNHCEKAISVFMSFMKDPLDYDKKNDFLEIMQTITVEYYEAEMKLLYANGVFNYQADKLMGVAS